MRIVWCFVAIISVWAHGFVWAGPESVPLVPMNESLGGAADAQVPEVVARIGNEIISGTEFQRDLEYRLRRMEAVQGRSITPDAAFRRETLQDVIDGRILKILARNAGIVVTDEEVAAEFEQGRAALGSEDAFQTYLKREGMTEDYLLQEIRKRLMTEKWVEQKTADIHISEEDLRREYERWTREGRLVRTGRTADIAHILVRVASENPEDEDAARKRIEAIRDRILAGENFQDVAREVSEDPISAPLGGEYLEAAPGKMLPEVEERLFTLPIGEVSEPFRSRHGWHIMTVLGQNAPGVISYERARELLHTSLRNARKNAILSKIVEDAKKVLDIEIFRISEDSKDNQMQEETVAP